MNAPLHHVLRAQQFDRPLLEELFERARELRQILIAGRQPDSHLAGRLLVNLFYEPSTRTRLSFAAAAAHMGMQVISTENAQDFSSAAKGETLEDTVRVVEQYLPAAIVLRHPETGSAERAAAVSSVPIINAGDGIGQHPTQALLDLYTIQQEQERLDGLTVLMGGDLTFGRTARSLAYLLSKFDDIKLLFVAPPQLQMGEDILAHLDEHGVSHQQKSSLTGALGQADVVYWTRLQKERFPDPELYDQVRGRFVIGGAQMAHMRPTATLMHPLPRVDEITPQVDNDPRAAYFRQAGNGLFVRAALLERCVPDLR